MIIDRTEVYQYLRKYYKYMFQYNYINISELKKRLCHNDYESCFKKTKDKLENYLSTFLRENCEGKFKLSTEGKRDIYSSCYYIMSCSLLDFKISKDRCNEIMEFIYKRQDRDGLFYDENLINYAYIKEDGWGARHLMPHLIILYERLNRKPLYNFEYLSAYHKYENMMNLINSLNWNNAWSASNFVMNIGVMLQYERDFMNVSDANDGIKAIQEWLLENIRTDSGMWYKGNINSKVSKYEMIRGAYHLYPILFYDDIDIPYKEKAIDIILSLQNKYGGFDFRINSSACEDIDAIEPLIRLSILTNGYRKEEVRKALEKALVWCVHNQMEDGGFVFRKGEKFNYGHENMASGINESNMFATWFRTLCVCYIYDFLTETRGRYVRVPGYEYPLWGEKGINEE